MNSIYSSELYGRDQWRPGGVKFSIPSFDSGRAITCCAESAEFFEVPEQELAQALNERGIAWKYKPRTFAVEWDDDGNFVDSFTPAFFIPSYRLFLEPVSAESRLLGEKARKARMLRHQYPAIKVEVLSVEDSIHLFDLALLAEAN